MFYEIADFLEIQDVDFKPRAYRRAARNIESLSEDIEEVYARGELEEIDRVGSSLADKIAEYLETGSLEYYEELKSELPIDIDAITRVEGVGPKTAKELYEALDITDLDDLEAAAEAGEIAEIKGFGEKTQQNILEHIDLARRGQERMLLGRVIPTVEQLKQELSSREEFKKVKVVGSYRRRCPTVGDVDILATSSNANRAMEVFTSQSDVIEVISEGETRSSVRVANDLQIDLRIVEDDSYGAALQYFTGSQDHNITTRNRAIERDLKLNEYGLFRSDDEVIAGETEEEVYSELDMEWVPPELREDTGEVEAAAEGSLPDLLEQSDIRGDLQMHTEWSDGSNTVQEMAQKADDLGYEYILITDHGPSLQVANGLSREEFREQSEVVSKVNNNTDVTVLHGIEANIVSDGLDVPVDWLEEVDIAVFALHDRAENATQKVVEVIEQYPVDIFAHPQNRIINEREPLDLELDTVIQTAGRENVAIEINAQPDRLDLDWRSVKEYRGSVEYTISTDSHVTSGMDYMRHGVDQARRGWCERSDVLNTRELGDLLAYFND